MVGKGVALGVAVVGCWAQLAYAHTEILLRQDFEQPLMPHQATCGPFVDPRPLQQLYPPASGMLYQVGRVETLLPLPVRYGDPSGKARSAVLGLRSDSATKLAFTTDAQFLDYMNIAFDLSPIDVEACGGPFNPTTPKLRISVYDTPGGQFEFGAGKPMESVVVEGRAGSHSWTFAWRRVLVSLRSSDPTDGNITIVFEPLEGGYMALDNIIIGGNHAPGDPGADVHEDERDAGHDAGGPDVLVDAGAATDAPGLVDGPTSMLDALAGADAAARLDASSDEAGAGAPAVAGGGGCSCSWAGGAGGGAGISALFSLLVAARCLRRGQKRKQHIVARGGPIKGGFPSS